MVQGHLTNTNGNFNVASGTAALQNNDSGEKNTATGARSLRFNTPGNNNSALGYEALRNNKTGNNNTIGFFAGDSIIIGDSNVIIGHHANINNIISKGINQIVIGASIGMGDSTVRWFISYSGNVFAYNININREYILPKKAGDAGSALRYPSTGKTLERV